MSLYGYVVKFEMHHAKQDQRREVYRIVHELGGYHYFLLPDQTWRRLPDTTVVFRTEYLGIQAAGLAFLLILEKVGEPGGHILVIKAEDFMGFSQSIDEGSVPDYAKRKPHINGAAVPLPQMAQSNIEKRFLHMINLTD